MDTCVVWSSELVVKSRALIKTRCPETFFSRRVGTHVACVRAGLGTLLRMFSCGGSEPWNLYTFGYLVALSSHVMAYFSC